MNRKEEVRRLLSLSTEELIAESKGQLKVTETLDELYEYLAEEMVAEFRKAAKGARIINFIMPVGPTQPYRIMAEKSTAKASRSKMSASSSWMNMWMMSATN